MKIHQAKYILYPVIACISIVTFLILLNGPFMRIFTSTVPLLKTSFFYNNSINSFKNEPCTNSEVKTDALSLERGDSCQLRNQDLCGRVNKSLVVSFWRNMSYGKWLPKNIGSVFPTSHFDHIIMLHDDTNWSTYPDYKTFVWISVANQVRFWYIKRFLPPHVLRAYNYVWVIDDDARLTFDPLVYECVVKRLDVPFSSPTRLSGPAFHQITQQDVNYQKNIGRWTDFVEIGPVVVGEGSVWACLWHYFVPSVGAGYGLDFIWCRIIGEKCYSFPQRHKVCGMLDVFGVHHDSNGFSGVGNFGDDVSANDAYKNFTGQNQNLGFLSESTEAFNKCSSGNP